MSATTNAVLRQRVARQGLPLVLPGASDAMVARLLEDVGAEAIYVSGAGLSNSYLGMPDLGLLTVTELVSQVTAIRDVVELPLLVDADTGFGNTLNVWRTVRALERAGANAIQLEDQVTPKRCGHFAGKGVIEPAEMVQKIYAAVDARVDDDLLIIARTDARAELGLNEALDRAQLYREAGADVLFVEAPESIDEITKIASTLEGALILNMVEGGLTPILPLAEVDELGYSVVLYANSVIRGGLMGMRTVAEHLLKAGDTLEINHQIADWQARQGLVRKPFFDEMSDRYAAMADELVARPRSGGAA